MAGSTLILIPRFDAERFLRAIGEHRAIHEVWGMTELAGATSATLSGRLQRLSGGDRTRPVRTPGRRVPRAIQCTTEVPMTSSGKIMRRPLTDTTTVLGRPRPTSTTPPP
jgi:acyl-coenzyme A synthetase/AMP-(fatty) acid ligase